MASEELQVVRELLRGIDLGAMTVPSAGRLVRRLRRRQLERGSRRPTLAECRPNG